MPTYSVAATELSAAGAEISVIGTQVLAIAFVTRGRRDPGICERCAVIDCGWNGIRD